jgi:hypothetical protein
VVGGGGGPKTTNSILGHYPSRHDERAVESYTKEALAIPPPTARDRRTALTGTQPSKSAHIPPSRSPPPIINALRVWRVVLKPLGSSLGFWQATELIGRGSVTWSFVSRLAGGSC